MHKADIKALIEKKGSTLAELDRLYNLPEGATRDALRRKRPEAELAIAQFLELPPSAVFPNRYDVAGNRIDRRRKSTNVEVIAKSKSRQPKSEQSSAITERHTTSTQGDTYET